MIKQKTIKTFYKSKDFEKTYMKSTIKVYKSGDIGIFRTYSYRSGEEMHFVSPEEYEAIKEIIKKSTPTNSNTNKK